MGGAPASILMPSIAFHEGEEAFFATSSSVGDDFFELLSAIKDRRFVNFKYPLIF